MSQSGQHAQIRRTRPSFGGKRMGTAHQEMGQGPLAAAHLGCKGTSKEHVKVEEGSASSEQ